MFLQEWIGAGEEEEEEVEFEENIRQLHRKLVMMGFEVALHPIHIPYPLPATSIPHTLNPQLHTVNPVCMRFAIAWFVDLKPES